ncbi:MAG TPA: YggS family pyridoxal phosphate-dependent enzyme [Candidatus Nanopelagicaceae bacterium]|nr:YggS family pyridoxal phosphate-dependent enzyme [Candidatus Nanopelagicaceae bacterium]
MSDPGSLAERLTWLRGEISAAAVRAGRDPREVALLPVTKGQPERVAAAALAEGLTALGENYVQECSTKDLDLTASGRPRPHWHLLGHLQRNKVRIAADLFSLIETVDSLALARAISAAREGRAPLPILCEVDFTGLPGRKGYAPEQLVADLAELERLPGILVRGLMTVAAREQPALSFQACRALRDRLSQLGGGALPVLSMGMSEDFRDAIAAGSTQVRVGTLLFGSRA